MTRHAFAHPANAVDMTGQVIGTLLVVGEAGSDRVGLILWHCTCTRCGATYTRNGAYLRSSSERLKHSVGCRQCRRTRLQQILLVRFRKYGTWWTMGDSERLCARIASALEVRGHRAPTETASPDSWSADYAPGHETEKRFGHIHPVTAPADHVLRCVACADLFEVGFGCVECIEPVCAECEAKHLHRCVSQGAVWTLQEVGAEHGFTREYARQVELVALTKLRRHFPKLREFLEAA